MSRYWYNSEQRLKDNVESFKELSEVTQRKLEHQYPRKEIDQSQSLYSSTWPQIVKEVKEFAKKWKKTADDVRLDHYTYNDYGSESSALDMRVDGLETDDQYYSRLWETHDSTCKQEERERLEFDRLKAKFT